MRRIVCFGDSWTEGIGVELEPGNGITDQKYSKSWSFEKKTYSYPAQLSNLFENKFRIVNLGVGGNSNSIIFQNVYDFIFNSFDKTDIFLIGLSSIIREPLNFFPKNIQLVDESKTNDFGFINYSSSCHLNGMGDNFPHWISDIKLDNIKKSFEEMYMDFIVNRFDDYFMYYISMNHIANLQKVLDVLGIKYYFFNMFENNLSTKIEFYDMINPNNWILFNYTFSEYLLDEYVYMDKTLPYGLWEGDLKNVEKNQDGPHPNRLGYNLIAKKIFEEIKNHV